MYYQYELTHFKGDMGHGVASDADVSLLILHAVFSRGPHRPGGTTYRDVC